MDAVKSKLSDYHSTTGCQGEIRPYQDSKPKDDIVGFYCSLCKKEWLSDDFMKHQSPEMSFKPVEHHVLPTFSYFQVSDTGSFVRWKNVKVLKPGDHIAWLRFISYWHHAIVEEINEEEITVIEWSSRGIRRTRRTKFNFWGNCCYSPMYKVFYPEKVLDQNPSKLVLLRARTRLNESGYDLLSDNCEHFATFCKTGSHTCTQLVQLKVGLRGWLRKFITTFIHICLVVFLSESVEGLADGKREAIGVSLIIVGECIYLGVVIFIMYRYDTSKQQFHQRKTPNPKCTSALCRAAIRTLLTSVFALALAITFSLYIAHKLSTSNLTPSKKTGCEILFGIIGGTIGNMLGFIVFVFIPYPFCRNEIKANAQSRPQEDKSKSDEETGRDEERQTFSEGSTSFHDIDDFQPSYELVHTSKNIWQNAILLLSPPGQETLKKVIVENFDRRFHEVFINENEALTHAFNMLCSVDNRRQREPKLLVICDTNMKFRAQQLITSFTSQHSEFLAHCILVDPYLQFEAPIAFYRYDVFIVFMDGQLTRLQVEERFFMRRAQEILTKANS
ncbi:hypothetical protein HOLleu_05060 [Holothuria leucospilota]|uniref:LRAT domain-containing protein n=1 Tax=Holothuria leucospilota TaxID=206669 RepID=A0A9Q1CKU7_HOLLE|nr:hypothetical protein HOLleu_05060 [Holothuria leucospilota]